MNESLDHRTIQDTVEQEVNDMKTVYLVMSYYGDTLHGVYESKADAEQEVANRSWVGYRMDIMEIDFHPATETADESD